MEKDELIQEIIKMDKKLRTFPNINKNLLYRMNKNDLKEMLKNYHKIMIKMCDICNKYINLYNCSDYDEIIKIIDLLI